MKLRVESYYDVHELDERISVWFYYPNGMRRITEGYVEQTFGLSEESKQQILLFLNIIANTVNQGDDYASTDSGTIETSPAGESQSSDRAHQKESPQ